MKRFLLSGLMVFSVFIVFGQQQYFVFIQDVSGEPFYVRMGEKSFSSSPIGHLILSRLDDTTYTMFIGFPKDKEPEQQFLIKMYSRDRGYELKKMNGIWELFDLQTMEFTKPIATVIKEKLLQPRKTDTYSELMAGVVDDSTVLYTNVVMAEPVKKKDTIADSTIAVKDTVVVKTKHGKGKDKALAKNRKPVKIKQIDSSVAMAGQTDTVKRQAAKDTVAVVKPAEQAAAQVVAKGDSMIRQKMDTMISQKPDTIASLKPDGLVGPKPDSLNSPKPDTTERGLRNLSSVLITRYSSENKVEGREIIYIDRTGAVPDTIRLIIPRL